MLWSLSHIVKIFIMKVFDCTTFFNENLMLDIRFNILDPYIDKFIVCESRYTHSGKTKKINLEII